MTLRLLTEHHLEFQSLKGGCRGLSKSTHVKMPHCWKSHATTHLFVSVDDPKKYVIFCGLRSHCELKGKLVCIETLFRVCLLLYCLKTALSLNI